MLWCVAGFGVFTIMFGLSRSLAISLVALLLLGASDMVSVIIRGILVQLATPDEMRGRVNAVDMIFIGVSNEFGEFESGLTAHWFGTVPAVVLGGVGTLVVIAIWAWAFPELSNADQLTVGPRTRGAAPRLSSRAKLDRSSCRKARKLRSAGSRGGCSHVLLASESPFWPSSCCRSGRRRAPRRRARSASCSRS